VTTPKDFLVFSETHSLVPVAHRLRLHGVPTELIIRKKSFEKAWDGKITKVLRKQDGTLNNENLDIARTRVASGDTCLISDTPYLHEFSGPNIFATMEWAERPEGAARVGAWFDGETLRGHHLIVMDLGAWPGGLGPPIAGGITLVIPPIDLDMSFMDQLWKPIADKLKAQGFKGLVQAGMQQSTETGDIELHGVEAGWPWLHTHAWLSELTNLDQVLLGAAAPVFETETRYVVALPVSIPPWPIWPVQSQSRAVELSLEGLSHRDATHWFWHDVTIEAQAGELRSAGQDGLLGVARGSGHHLELARAFALEQAAKLQVPGKQLRADVAAQTSGILASLELRFGIKVG
jgi:hypothetical protein